MAEEKKWTFDKVKDMVGETGAGVVIPVNRKIEVEQKVLNFWYVEELLRKTDRIAVGECWCRRKMQNCGHTLEGCLYLNDWVDEAVREGHARLSSFPEALSILKRTYDDGLVLMAGVEDPPVKICSCCSCCCFLFAGLLQFGLKNSILNSDFVARVDDDICESCGTCVSRCHFGAMVAVDGRVVFEQEKCFGCGLCVGTCPAGALELPKR